ncbi:hypothetical protein JVT61DRAFT_4885 [Boletus reticuloceps]|uniref:Uncharacterized protein n=1 Tax=Boletus reticuloceps TaxID=495285 RepID=A0A8I3A8U1_9AGAM|nr:hypothetical protein JVT61DRAFT_4885 [Boletus reticuloceps]
MDDDDDPHNLKRALTAGLEKLRKHLKKVFDFHFPLLGAVLHPSIHLTYFQDSSKWASNIPARAEMLLEHLFDEYSDDISTGSNSAPSNNVGTAVEEPKSIFDHAIMFGVTTNFPNTGESATGVLKQSELASYFGGAYPCKNRNDPSQWWKACFESLP